MSVRADESVRTAMTDGGLLGSVAGSLKGFRRPADLTKQEHIQLRHDVSASSAGVCDSVNFHITRECNFVCPWCFHTKKGVRRGTGPPNVPLLKRALDACKAVGTQKVNFAGGEPTLYVAELAELICYAKTKLGLFTSIISNGTNVPELMETLGARAAADGRIALALDVCGLSLHSASSATLGRIGYRAAKGTGEDTYDAIRAAAAAVHNAEGVRLKFNTTIGAQNCSAEEAKAISELMVELRPKRWKVLQLIECGNENAGRVDRYAIDAGTFASYKSTINVSLAGLGVTAQSLGLVFESEKALSSSYVLVDEAARLLSIAGDAANTK